MAPSAEMPASGAQTAAKEFPDTNIDADAEAENGDQVATPLVPSDPSGKT